MAKTAVVVDENYLKHEPGEFHPERPERIQVLLDLANDIDPEKFQILAAARRHPQRNRILP
jgi:acetoin utilization deacetylase AcuC-like enzyme